jgi:pyruvate dehydrogenase E1 component alpha subunit
LNAVTLYPNDLVKRVHEDQTLVHALKTMIKTRIVDERMIILQRQGIITFAMSSLGEEACAVGSAAALDLGDWMYPQYREAGILFWRGFSIEDYVHHMFGDAKDLILGRQMPNHFGSRALNVVTVSSPIGSKIPHAAGCAYAMLMQKDPHVAICYFGEGATSEGDFHVGLNFAAVRKAPCIFFCRNNGYAISTPVERQFASDGIAPKGEGYGMKSFRVDGNDFFAVYDAVLTAKEYALQGNGPVLIEAMTYRMGAHSTSDDPTRYRKEAEVERWKDKCPILRLRQVLEQKNLWNAQIEEEWKTEINLEIDEAILKAQNTPKPNRESLIEGVYFEVPEKLKAQLDEAAL